MADRAFPPWIAPTAFFLVLVGIIGFFMFTQADQPHFQAPPGRSITQPTGAWPPPGTRLEGHWGSGDRRGGMLVVGARHGASASFTVALDSGESLEVEGMLRGETFRGRTAAPGTPWDGAVVELEVGDRRLHGRYRAGELDEAFSFERR